MNKEGCLDWLCRLKSEIFVYMPVKWHASMAEALDMVITDLSQEPCKDAINRTEVLKAVEFEHKWLLGTELHHSDIDVAFDSLKDKIALMER